MTQMVECITLVDQKLLRKIQGCATVRTLNRTGAFYWLGSSKSAGIG